MEKPTYVVREYADETGARDASIEQPAPSPAGNL
jgi:hypothetical protein